MAAPQAAAPSTTRTISISVDEQEALTSINYLLTGVYRPEPNFLTRIDPDNMEEDLSMFLPLSEYDVRFKQPCIRYLYPKSSFSNELE